MPLPEPAAGLTSRWLFPSLELFDRTRSCGVLESRTASEMTDRRVLRLGRRVTPPGTTGTPIEGVTTLGLYCGIDWATDHHDVAVVDDDGRVVARGRVGNDAAGFAQLLTLLAEAGDSAEHPIPVGIETDRGLWVAALRETGRVIYPINPLAASRYRARYAVSGAKSDATDAVLLANIVRTDRRRAPAAARRHRAGPSHPGAGAGPTRRGVGASADRQPDPRPAQRLLPGRPRRVRRAAQRGPGPRRCAHHPGGRAHPRPSRQADPGAAAPAADQGRPPTQPRPRRRAAAAGLHRHLPAPAAGGRKRDGHPAQRAAAPVRRRLCGRRRAGRGGDRPF